MTTSRELYVGLISGTSLDGIDAALVDFGAAQPTLITAATYPFAPALHSELVALCQPGVDEIERMGRADRALGEALATAVKTLLDKADVAATAVRAIGSHGQTIRHRPRLAGDSSPHPFTLQIGDPATIAHRTGITTIADFRRRDIAAGGQGAPLVPAFHRAVFGGRRHRVIVNIGGIANITALPSEGGILGFDTGPGNGLMDAWIRRHQSRSFDRDGSWAATGQPQPTLLAALLADPYFALPAPKSTGREYFHLDWLDQQLAGHPGIAPADVQATLLELTATSIAQTIAALPFVANEVFICGGGAHNCRLMLRLEALLHPRLLANTGELGIAPDWVEAAAFAWLARETLANRPGNAPAVTGADRPCVLGAIHPA